MAQRPYKYNLGSLWESLIENFIQNWAILRGSAKRSRLAFLFQVANVFLAIQGFLLLTSWVGGGVTFFRLFATGNFVIVAPSLLVLFVVLVFVFPLIKIVLDPALLFKELFKMDLKASLALTVVLGLFVRLNAFWFDNAKSGAKRLLKAVR